MYILLLYRVAEHQMLQSEVALICVWRFLERLDIRFYFEVFSDLDQRFPETLQLQHQHMCQHQVT